MSSTTLPHSASSAPATFGARCPRYDTSVPRSGHGPNQRSTIAECSGKSSPWRVTARKPCATLSMIRFISALRLRTSSSRRATVSATRLNASASVPTSSLAASLPSSTFSPASSWRTPPSSRCSGVPIQMRVASASKSAISATTASEAKRICRRSCA